MSNPDSASWEVENHALRAEIAWLQAERLVKAEYQALAEAYQHSQVRFRSVFEASPLGQQILGPDLTIRQANPAVAALLGLASPEVLLEQSMLDFVPTDQHAGWAQLREALWEQHRPSFVLETRLLRADGAPLWCQVTCVLFVEQGQEWGFTTLEDITARKQAEAWEQQQVRAANEELAVVNEELRVTNEELLEANSLLAHTNAELDTFVYAVFFDLKAPLLNLESLIEALTQELPPTAEQPGPVSDILDLMQQAVARFRYTLDSLTELGAVPAEGGRHKVNLAALLEQVRHELLPLLAETGGQLLVDLAGQPQLTFSEKNLRRLLLQLIGHGLTSRHPDRAPVVRVSSQRTEGQVVLRVQDNGQGLDAQQQAQLWCLPPPAEGAGAGMGLYLVKKIVKHAGGSIRVESQPGRGATFIIALPG